MFRTAIVRALRTSVATKTAAPAFRAVQISSSFARTQAPVSRITAIRCYASGSGLNEEEVTGRILDLLKNFDKVQDPTKLSPTSHFVKDLSLDSLDTVEVVMAIEEEFSIEIPDKAADAIHSVNEAVKYILEQPDGEKFQKDCKV